MTSKLRFRTFPPHPGRPQDPRPIVTISRGGVRLTLNVAAAALVAGNGGAPRFVPVDLVAADGMVGLRPRAGGGGYRLTKHARSGCWVVGCTALLASLGYQPQRVTRFLLREYEALVDGVATRVCGFALDSPESGEAHPAEEVHVVARRSFDHATGRPVLEVWPEGETPS